ncbi:MAG TPA: SUMF1/EgtB/PvdO family nonheme iron enzyme, partial [Thermoanaerobaculia bacterium]|nr:SUMF1/EgtB/PvdO family nonheme iron enzyme [Thermoanaerobaculia bacterium]
MVVLVLLGFPIAVVLAWAYDVTPDGVRRTGPVETAAPDQVESTPVPARSRFWPAVSALLAVLLVVVVVFALRARFQDSAERRARALLPTIAELAEEGSYSEAFRLAGDASRSLEGDTALARMWPRVADHLTVRTDPPGATEAARPFNGGVEAGDEEFEVLGTTPLELHRIPRTPHLIRIERTGFAPVERLVSSALLRTEAQMQSAPAIEVDVVLVPEAEAPDDMVLVPGGMYELVTPDLPEDRRAMLDDYSIDRYEVSNAGFREFVAGGGYATRTLWPAPIVTESDTLDFEAAMDRLVDRTGLPGPRGWTGREYPEGRGNHPVSGITWYEAAAYCAFRGKRLPTIFQWEKAARDGRITHYEGVVMPWGLASFGTSPRARANFGSAGTVPVDAHPFGISPYGAYAMAGNVKEWVANPFGPGRGATGGSWEDPMYLFSEVGALDPFFASES